MTEKNEKQAEREAFNAWWSGSMYGQILEITGDTDADATSRIAKAAAFDAYRAALAQQPQAATVAQGLTAAQILDAIMAGLNDEEGELRCAELDAIERRISDLVALAPSASAQQAEPVPDFLANGDLEAALWRWENGHSFGANGDESGYRLALYNWRTAAHAHSASPTRIETLRKALFESRDAMRVMANWVKKSDPAGHSWGARMVDRANAALSADESAAPVSEDES